MAGTREITTGDQALSLCAEIESHQEAGRVLVGFTVHDGLFFAIGLGHEDSCTLYWESVDPPYFQSRGSGQPRKSVDFAYDGQRTELPGTVLVDRDTAFGALVKFVETGRRSEGVVWEET